MGKFYCYVLRKPDKSPFYVGFGNILRITKAGYRRNAGVNRIIRDLHSQGINPVRTIEEFDSEQEAKSRELELILLWGRRVDGGLLENMRIGDRGGVHGRKLGADQVRKLVDSRGPHTEAFKSAMSARMMGNQHRRGYVYTDEQRKLKSEQTRAGIARKRAERLLHV